MELINPNMDNDKDGFLKGRKLPKETDAKEDYDAAVQNGNLNPADVGEERAIKKDTFRDWAQEKIDEKRFENALYDSTAKKMPENVLTSRIEGWMYTTRADNPLKGDYTRAFIVRGEDIEPDISAIVEYTGLPALPGRNELLENVLKEEYSHEANRPFLEYMLYQHEAIKRKEADYIWTQWPQFKLKEVQIVQEKQAIGPAPEPTPEQIGENLVRENFKSTGGYNDKTVES